MATAIKTSKPIQNIKGLGKIQSEFVRELRSGKHKQIKGKMCCVDKKTKNPCYCALGILALVMWRMGYNINWVLDKNTWEVNGCSSYLDNESCQKAGLISSTTLANLNDDGYSFNQIADLIVADPSRFFFRKA